MLASVAIGYQIIRAQPELRVTKSPFIVHEIADEMSGQDVLRTQNEEHVCGWIAS
jgi:hypothetical protein